MKKRFTKVTKCPTCNRTRVAHRPNAKFCSDACRQKAYRRRNQSKVEETKHRMETELEEFKRRFAQLTIKS